MNLKRLFVTLLILIATVGLVSISTINSDMKSTDHPFPEKIYSLPVTADFSSNVTTGLHPTVAFTDTSTNTPTSWLWDFGDGINSTSQNPTHTYSTNGTYTVTLIATNGSVSDSEVKTNYIYSYGITHPRLMNVQTSPGRLNNTTEPWSTYEAKIRVYADEGLTQDYHTPYAYGTAWTARRVACMAMVYQIDGNTIYANKTVEALLHSEDTFVDTGEGTDLLALQDYAIAYDLIWQTHGVNSTLDNTNITLIQNHLSQIANTSYYTTYISNPTIKNFTKLTRELGIAITAEVLADYVNRSLLSTPTDLTPWRNLGYSNMFVNDTLHTHPTGEPAYGSGKYETLNNGIFGYQAINIFDGRLQEGQTYKHYFAGDLYRWAQIYDYIYGENLLETFPKLKAFAMEEIWSNFPNFYSSNTVAGGQKYSYSGRIAYSLLDATNRSYIRWQLENSYASGLAHILPHADEWYDYNNYDPVDLYMFYGNYSAEATAAPTRLNSLNANYNYQTIRGDWTTDSDWIQFDTWNQILQFTARASEHGDQQAFEYYSKGDLLMPDGGEIKYYTPLASTYGADGAYHNTLLINNSYPSGLISNVTERGIYKSTNYRFTPFVDATVSYLIDNSNVSYIQAYSNITKLTNSTTGVQFYNASYPETDVSPTINYSRGILYPFKDYMIVIDRAKSTGSYGYTNLFRFGSLRVNITTVSGAGDTCANPSCIGDVTGDLSIEGTAVNWRSVPLFAEVMPGTQMNYIDWNTTNPYGDPVRLKLYTSPKTTYTYQKFLTRIGGYAGSSEVSNPQVYLKKPAGNTLYRVTTLLSRYENETPRTPSELAVTGMGSAIKIISADSTYTDYIYTGLGNSTFSGFSTDADTVFVRSNAIGTYALIINGTFLNYEGTHLIIGNTGPYYEYSGG